MNKIFKNTKNENIVLLDTVTSRELKKLKAGEFITICVSNITLLFKRNEETNIIEMTQLETLDINIVVKHNNTIVLSEEEYNTVKNGTPLLKKDCTLLLDEPTGNIYATSTTIIKDFIIR